jgi:DNA-binding transcriptional regulator/RsmH inhibitor MraZ
MDYAGIKNEVLILGVLERIELWDPTVYLEYEKNQPATYETVVERVLKPGP